LNLAFAPSFNCSQCEHAAAERFRSGEELLIAKNPAFTLDDPVQRERLAREYRKTSALYCQGQPDFELLVARIRQNILTM